MLLVVPRVEIVLGLGCDVHGIEKQRPGSLRRRRITGLRPYKNQSIESTSTAIIFPIYNEDSVRVLEGLRATYESLKATGQARRRKLMPNKAPTAAKGAPAAKGAAPAAKAAKK